MPSQPIPFVPNQESGNDILGGASPLSMNVVIDGKGSVRRRPGIGALVPSDKSVTGLSSTAKTSGIYVDNRGVLFLSQEQTPGGVQHLFRADLRTDRTLHGVTFSDLGVLSEKGSLKYAETEAMVVVASGGALQKVLFSAPPEAMSVLGGSPPEATHIVANASRLIANDIANPNRITFSGQAAGATITGHETWSGTGTGFISAEARPDPILALAENTDEVFAFGQTNLQVFAPDPSTFYAPVATREVGIGAANSVIKVEQRFAWLDDRRRFAVSDGREFQFLNTPAIKGTLDAMGMVSDCFGYRVLMGPIDCLVWTFPTANVTLAYQMGGGWSQWGRWDAARNNWGQFAATSHAFNRVQHENYVSGDNGVVGVLSLDSSTDLDGSSTSSVAAFIHTGSIDRGTAKRKRCIEVALTLRRGDPAASENPQGHLQYRDENASWSGKLPIRLGSAGDVHPVVRLKSLGTYRTRQWRIWFDGTEPFVLVKAEEQYEVLEV